jgi:3-isopropylmalate/(R)-2-methylmalate dehydratase small subunit
MQPLRIHSGVAVPFYRKNVDTDQIIPKQFLKRTERSGFGAFLFNDLRYGADGAPDSAFVLNDPAYTGASILIAGGNFGCGSSREHAVWALVEFGVRVVIAPSFAEIFSANSLKNGLVTVALPEDQVASLVERARRRDGYRLTIDIGRRSVEDARGFRATFPLDDFSQRCLLEGLDEIGLTEAYEAQIAAYEANSRHFIRKSAARLNVTRI